MALTKPVVLLPSGDLTEQRAADTLVVGEGLRSSSGDLRLDAYGLAIRIGADKHLVGDPGVGGVDLSAMLGTLRTPQGPLFLGPGNTVFSGDARFLHTVTLEGETQFLGPLETTAVSTFRSLAYFEAGLDRAGLAPLYIGTHNATQVEVGRPGQLVRVRGNLQVDGVETIVGRSAFQQNPTFDGHVRFGAQGSAEFLGPVTFRAQVYSTFLGPGLAVAGSLSVNQGITSLGPIDHTGTFTLQGALLHSGGEFRLESTQHASVNVLDGMLYVGAEGQLTLQSRAAEVLVRGARDILLEAITGDVDIDAAQKVVLRTDCEERLRLEGTDVVVSDGARLTTEGSGTVNLPNRDESRFAIEGENVGPSVTARSLIDLTLGPVSNADHLHSHAPPDQSDANKITVGPYPTDALAHGRFGYLADDGVLYPTDADDIDKSLFAGLFEGKAAFVTASGMAEVVFIDADPMPRRNQLVFLARGSMEPDAAGKVTTQVVEVGVVAAVGLVRAVDPLIFAEDRRATIFIQYSTPVERTP